jgi:GTPase involved in cell partitioning and DNA repair
LNKIDLVDQEELETLRHELENQFKEDLFIYCISAAKKNGTQQLMRDIGKFMESSDD